MRNPRYQPAKTRNRPPGPVLAMPADAHEVFQRDAREALQRARGVHAVPSHMHLTVSIESGWLAGSTVDLQVPR